MKKCTGFDKKLCFCAMVTLVSFIYWISTMSTGGFRQPAFKVAHAVRVDPTVMLSNSVNVSPGVRMPQTVKVPPVFTVPPVVKVPSAVTVPNTMEVHHSDTEPPAVKLPTGFKETPEVKVPHMITVPPAVKVTPGVKVPPGLKVPSEVKVPQTVTVPPTVKVPSGLKVPPVPPPVKVPQTGKVLPAVKVPPAVPVTPVVKVPSSMKVLPEVKVPPVVNVPLEAKVPPAVKVPPLVKVPLTAKVSPGVMVPPVIMVPHAACPVRVSDDPITRLTGTEHLLVSAYVDGRYTGKDMRVISIVKRYPLPQLHCVFCCRDSLTQVSPARVAPHPHLWGYKYVSTYITCQIPVDCRDSHVAVVPSDHRNDTENLTWLPVRNQKQGAKVERKFEFNLTVCISVMYEPFNDVLRTAQVLEMYRLLGVDKVVLYNTSSGPEVARLLRSYGQDGLVEIIPWPIDKFLHVAPGWLPSTSHADVHYFGQLVTLNDCIYRSMERSRYVLLNDVDEIIMPYRHDDLVSMMNELQQQHPDVSEFQLDSQVFTPPENATKIFGASRWEGVPGHDIMQRIHRARYYRQRKMIVQPRLTEETSVHLVTRRSGKSYLVPEEVCRVVHVRDISSQMRKQKEPILDKRLLDFQQKLIPAVDRVLKCGYYSRCEQDDQKT
ncbi:uncharacterized protein LOC130916989 [Corythoichthys intestinalis]|uniref:uncharacterized protein LOC130916989 n=1 Tax=Corythoichthys intestinalis TaxID=161448 RepID=UPI0025A51D05|nr:uncharacterized protein LOC130916989 [Corythoichthys intestinalis]